MPFPQRPSGPRREQQAQIGRLCALSLLLLAVLLPSPAQAAPGDLDPSFATDGIYLHNDGMDRAYDTALDSSGRIVVAGDSSVGSFVARYLANGSPDPSFGGGSGRVLIHFSPVDRHDYVSALAIDANGRIVVGGTTGPPLPGNTDFAVARLTTSGQRDSSFGGGDGVVTTDISQASNDDLRGLAIDATGRIVVAGGAAPADAPPPRADLALARYSSAGVLDPTFASGGVFTSNPGSGGYHYAVDVAIDSLGRVVTASNDVIVRLSTTGQPDPTFGANGVVTALANPCDPTPVPQALAIDSANRIVIAGYGWASTPCRYQHFMVARYTASGAPDTTFGDGHAVTSSHVGLFDRATSVLIDGQGRLLVGGVALGAFDEPSFALVRYMTNGARDGAFGQNGFVNTHIRTDSDDELTDLALQADGAIVAGGYTESDNAVGYSDLALARYQGGGTSSPLPFRYFLEVGVGPNGSISGPGISCPGDCQEAYDSGTTVTLTATPAANYAVNGWTYGCAATGTANQCQLTMSADQFAGVSFRYQGSSSSLPAPTGSAGSGASGGSSDEPASLNRRCKKKHLRKDSSKKKRCKGKRRK